MSLAVLTLLLIALVPAGTPVAQASSPPTGPHVKAFSSSSVARSGGFWPPALASGPWHPEGWLMAPSPVVSQGQLTPPSDDIVPLRTLVLAGDTLSYLAAVPAFAFWSEGLLHAAPIIYEDFSSYNAYLVDDWMAYLGYFGGVEKVVYVGPSYSPDLSAWQDYLSYYYGVQPDSFEAFVSPDPYELSAMLAEEIWSFSDVAVLACFNSSAGPVAYYEEFSGELGTWTLVLNITSPIGDGEVQLASFSADETVGAFRIILDWNQTASDLDAYVLNPEPADSWPFSGTVVLFDGLGGWPLCWMATYYKPERGYYPNVLPNSTFYVLVSGYDVPQPTEYCLTVWGIPGDFYTVEVKDPDSVLYASITFNTSDYFTLYLVDPEGRLMAWDESAYLCERMGMPSPGRAEVMVAHPEVGNWTVIVSRWGGSAQTASYEGQVVLATYPDDLLDYAEGAANGAVIASLLNAPLLLVGNETVPRAVQEALRCLGARELILVDPGNRTTAGVISALEGLTGEVRHLSSMPEVVSFIRSLSNQSDVVLTDLEFLGPASLAGAYHGAPVVLFSYGGSDVFYAFQVENQWMAYWRHDVFGDPYGAPWYAFLFTPPGHGGALEYMYNVSCAFFNWLEGLGVEVPPYEWEYPYGGPVEPVTLITVLPPYYLGVWFDRVIEGRALEGRIPGYEPGESAAMLARSMLYRALVFANPGRDRVMGTFVAYAYGYPWVLLDTVYPAVLPRQNYTCNESEWIPGNATEMGFTVVNHTWPYTVCEELNEGVAFWYYSDHGANWPWTSINPWSSWGMLGFFDYLAAGLGEEPWRAFEFGGSPDNPDTHDWRATEFTPDHFVNPFYWLYFFSGLEFDLYLANVHSACMWITACEAGGSMLPYILMLHGAAAVVGSMVITTAEAGSAWGQYSTILALTEDVSYGEAYLRGLHRCSGGVYSLNKTGYYEWQGVVAGYPPTDESFWWWFYSASNGFIFYGDPELKVYKPSWSMPEAHTLAPRVRLTVSTTLARGGVPVRALVRAHDFETSTGALEAVLNVTYPDGTTVSIPMEYDASTGTFVATFTPGPGDPTGYYVLTAIVVDEDGDVGTASLTIYVDNTPPSAEVISPANGSYVGGTITVIVNATDEHALRAAELYLDGSLLASWTEPGQHSYTLDTTALADGRHLLAFRALDEAGNEAVLAVFIVVDNTPPDAGFIRPTDGYLSGSVEVLAYGFDDNLDRLELYVDGSPLASWTTAGIHSYTFNTTSLPDGPHVLELKAVDKAGNERDVKLSVVVDNTLPTAKIRAPKAGSSLTGEVAVEVFGNDTNFDHMELYIDGALVAKWTEPGAHTYRWDTTRHGDGTHVLKLVVVDKAGNKAESSVEVITKNVARSKAGAATAAGIPLLVAGAAAGFFLGKRR